MLNYEIKDVVSDYGLYENGELKLIINSRKNAEAIKRILEIDCSVPNVATIADFVEVVRCKDCKNVSCKQPNGIIHCFRNHREGTIFRKPDDFCSYGERK